MVRTTHTFAELAVSASTYDEISKLLRDAGYDHAFMDDGTIDMHGVGLTREKQTEATPKKLVNETDYSCPKCGAQVDERWDCCEVNKLITDFAPSRYEGMEP